MFKKLYKSIFRNRFITPILELKLINIPKYFKFWQSYNKYKKMDNAKDMTITARPILGEDTPKTNIDHHYFYQGIWAARHIANAKPEVHVDVGSRAEYVGFLTTITKIKFVDIRPLDAKIDNFENIKGDILNLPFENNSIDSLSCLHVAEHIGLGRYGDPLDPNGTKKACKELARILAPNGNLYFSLPIGRERLQFNAHRIHDPKTILEYFPNLELASFNIVDDKGGYMQNADMDSFKNNNYSCGLFIFTKS